ncbi:MAG: DMT family transporter [Burkholderiales bacterium]|nr:DMT family transporter [Burkholderiales bacterium]
MNTTAIFAACVLVWGTTWYAITFQLGPVAPELSVSYRFALAALAVALWCRVRGLALRFAAREHALLVATGVSMYGLGYVFVYHAERYVPSGLVAIGYSASPLLAILGLRLFFRQPMTARMAAGAALGIAGIALIYGPALARPTAAGDAAMGALLTAAAVLVSTAGALLAHRNQTRGLTGWPTMAWSMGYGAAATFLVAIALGRDLAIDLGARYLVSLAYLAFLGSVLAFAGWLTLVARIGVARASYVGVMAPVAAIFVSTALEGFEWHPLAAAGVAVSVAGNLLVLAGRR